MTGKRFGKTQYPDTDLLSGIGPIVIVLFDSNSADTEIGNGHDQITFEGISNQLNETQNKVKELENEKVSKWETVKILLEILVAVTAIGTFIVGEMAILAAVIFFVLK
jgi:hypothetical protein